MWASLLEKFVSWDDIQLFQTPPVFGENFSLFGNHRFGIWHAHIIGYMSIEKQWKLDLYCNRFCLQQSFASPKSFHRSSNINHPDDWLGRKLTWIRCCYENYAWIAWYWLLKILVSSQWPQSYHMTHMHICQFNLKWPWYDLICMTYYFCLNKDRQT